MGKIYIERIVHHKSPTSTSRLQPQNKQALQARAILFLEEFYTRYLYKHLTLKNMKIKDKN